MSDISCEEIREALEKPEEYFKTKVVLSENPEETEKIVRRQKDKLVMILDGNQGEGQREIGLITPVDESFFLLRKPIKGMKKSYNTIRIRYASLREVYIHD